MQIFIKYTEGKTDKTESEDVLKWWRRPPKAIDGANKIIDETAKAKERNNENLVLCIKINIFFSKLLRKTFWIFFLLPQQAPTGYVVRLSFQLCFYRRMEGTLYAAMSLMTILSSYNDFGTTESLNYFSLVTHEKDKKITSTFFYSYCHQSYHEFYSLCLSFLGCSLACSKLFLVLLLQVRFYRFCWFSLLLVICFPRWVHFFRLFRMCDSRSQ